MRHEGPFPSKYVTVVTVNGEAENGEGEGAVYYTKNISTEYVPILFRTTPPTSPRVTKQNSEGKITCC